MLWTCYINADIIELHKPQLVKNNCKMTMKMNKYYLYENVFLLHIKVPTPIAPKISTPKTQLCHVHLLPLQHTVTASLQTWHRQTPFLATNLSKKRLPLPPLPVYLWHWALIFLVKVFWKLTCKFTAKIKLIFKRKKKELIWNISVIHLSPTALHPYSTN